jgi:5-methylcytosine-specific restriction endonuclease McrA
MFWEGSKLLVTENKRTAPSLLSPGSVFGRLTATSEYEMRSRPDGRNRAYQKFNCECGNSVFLVGYSVKSGNTSSCGCLHKEQISAMMKTHGLSKTSAYRVGLNKARRAYKRASLVTDNLEKVTLATHTEILKEYNNTCWICEDVIDTVSWDHVKPLSKGGGHIRTNLRPTHIECNSRKSNKWPFTNEMKTKIANDVRALRTPQALPVTDGEEVSA